MRAWFRVLMVAAGCGGCSFMVGLNGRYRVHTESRPVCASGVVPPVLDLVVAGGAVLAVAAVLATLQGGEAGESSGAGILIAGFGTIGATGLASGLYGLHANGRCDRADRSLPPDPPHRDGPLPTHDAPLVESVQARDPLASRLTHEAHDAAVQQRCSGVRVLGSRVRELDETYFARVFLQDPAIASCER